MSNPIRLQGRARQNHVIRVPHRANQSSKIICHASSKRIQFGRPAFVNSQFIGHCLEISSVVTRDNSPEKPHDRTIR